MRWLRIALFLTIVAGLITTMVVETFQQKFLMGVLFSAVIGFLWAVLLLSIKRTDGSDWEKITKNVVEAQNLINQSSYSIYRRKLLGLQPKPDLESMDIIENLESSVSICLFIMLGVVLGSDSNFLDYVFSFQQQNPPFPRIVLFYFGFMFCFSTAFLGIFLRVTKRVKKMKG